MKSVNVRQLKNNPSEALREAARGPVLVLKGDHPEALLVHLDLDGVPEAPEVRLLLAESLLASGSVSLGRAARVAGVSVADLVRQVSRSGRSVIEGDADTIREDVETLEEWLGSS